MSSSLSLPPTTQTLSKTLHETPFLPPFSRPIHLSMPKSSLSFSTSPILSSQSLHLKGRHRDEIFEIAKESLSNCLSETHLDVTVPGLKAKAKGKVRDVYEGNDHLVLVTTDRQSAFDRVLASIPFKGQVLNETSLWWFNKTEHITPNAVVCAPDKNVTIAKKCSVFPVEFVVRGFVTGSTDTSLWTVYSKGIRRYCGNDLPDGMIKNQKLPSNILTPTTKATDHDVPVSPDEEFLRLWFKDRCNPYEDKVLPEAPEELVCELAWRHAVFPLCHLFYPSSIEMEGI